MTDNKPIIQIDIEMNNIVYAPNSFGKTISSNYYYEHLLNYDKNVELFTRKKVEELVTLSGERIYIGSGSSYEDDINKITKTLESELFDVFRKLSEIYQCKPTKKGFQDNSYYFKKTKFPNPKSALTWSLLLDFDMCEKHSFLKCNDILVIDKELKDFEDKSMLDLSETDNSVKLSKKPISKNQYESIILLFDMVKTNDLSECPLCGTDFKTNEVLRGKIENVLSNYSQNDISELEKSIQNLYSEMLDRHPKSKSKVWSVLDDKDLTICVIQYIGFIRGFEKNICYCITDFLDQEIGINYLKKKYSVIQDLREKSKYEKEKLYSEDQFLDDVIDEFKSQVRISSDMVINKNIDDLSLSFIVDGESKAPYDVMSESEVKKLCLAVMHSKIKNTNTVYIILDDPVDSYDDYSLIKSTEYIYNKIISLNVKWTIMSHNIEFILILSGYCNLNDIQFSYCYYRTTSNPLDMSYFNPIKQVSLIPLKHIKVFRNHDIKIVHNIIKQRGINSEYQIDHNFAFLSFFSVIRSFKMDLLNSLRIMDQSKSIRKRINKIEKGYLHYSIYIKTTMKEIEWIYHHWFKTNMKIPLYNQSSLALSERKRFLSLPHTRITRSSNDNIILVDVLYKILWVSECKFLLDEIIYLFCKNTLKLNDVELEKITGDSKVKPINKTVSKLKFIRKNYFELMNINDQNVFIELEGIYKGNSPMINNFSHSSSKFFPPYISTSIHEVRELYVCLSKLKSKILKMQP